MGDGVASRLATDPRVGVAVARVRRAGLRPTGLRVSIIETLGRDGDVHLTVDALQRALEADGSRNRLSAVYRALGELSRCGVVCSTTAGTATVHGLRTPPHHHAVCLECSRVAAVAGPAVDPAVATLAAATAFSVPRDGLRIHGVCSFCLPRLDAEDRRLLSR